MVASLPPKQLSVAAKFELKMAAKARAEEKEAEARKLLEGQMRKADLGGLPELNVPEGDEDVVKSYKERVHRFETFKARETHYPEKEVVVPWQSPWSDPQTRPAPPIGYDPVHEIYTASRELLTGRQDLGTDNLALQKLQADLESERRHVRELEQDLRSTAHQVDQLRAERDEAARQHRQAVYADAKAKAARLEARVVELKRLCEDSVQEKRRLEDEIERGRSRELELNRQLENARREKRQLEHEIEMERGRRTSGDTERKLPSKAKEERVTRRSSNRLDDTMTIKKTTIDYAIVVPKKNNTKRRGGCLLM